MENNGKSLKKSEYLTKRKKIILLFSHHCKERAWGKVHATKELARYYYSGDYDADERNRENFVNRWESIIETVINKPSHTTLTKYQELYDYIDGYMADVEPEKYRVGDTEEILLHLKKTFELIIGSDVAFDYDYINANLATKLFGVIGDVYKPKKFFTYGVDYFYCVPWKGHTYKVLYFRLNKKTWREDLNTSCYKGLLSADAVGGTIKLKGYLFNNFTKSFCMLSIIESRSRYADYNQKGHPKADNFIHIMDDGELVSGLTGREAGMFKLSKDDISAEQYMRVMNYIDKTIRM